MNLTHLNCAPKNAQNRGFYVVCVLPPIFKSCRDSKGLSRNTALVKPVSATKPRGSLPAACEYRGVSEIMCKSRSSFVRKLPAGCQRVCEYKSHAEGPSPLQVSRPHLPPLPSSPSIPFHPCFSIHSGCLNTMQSIFLNLGFIRQGSIS